MGMTLSPTACAGDVDYTVDSMGSTAHFVGTATWANNAESGAAHVDVTITDDVTLTTTCDSIYAVAFTRFQ